MAVIALTSARGAPGVSTTALAMALTWQRPTLLLEADTTGSSTFLAGYLRGTIGHDVGLVDLAMAQRDTDLLTSIQRSSIALPGGHARLVPGLTSPVQARTVAPVWDTIATGLHQLNQHGTDVVVDAGRLGALDGPQPLLRAADAVLLVTRATLPAIAALRAAAPVLRDDLHERGAGVDVLSLLVIGQGRPYSAKDISTALDLPVAACIDFDPVNAEVLSVGAPAHRRFQQSGFVRSINAANSAVVDQLERRAQRLDTTTLRTPQPEETPHA